jgi:hypothetical protein
VFIEVALVELEGLRLLALRLEHLGHAHDKHKSNKAENGKGIEGALGPGGLRGRVFGAARGETEGFNNSRSWGPPGQTSASRTSAVDLLDAVRQPARGSEGWAVVGGRMIREGS